ncbi:hypothetical protein ACFXKI_19185 [Streptomyces mirabilis]|uniref:hypothetical protein n=1 Tax=Streptomyces mirabilis TaxID=68239 RepID=UPI0036A586F8
MAGIEANFTGPHSPVRDSAAVAGLRSEIASERKMRNFLRDPASWAGDDRRAKSPSPACFVHAGGEVVNGCGIRRSFGGRRSRADVANGLFTGGLEVTRC